MRETNANKIRFKNVVSDACAWSGKTNATPMGITPLAPPGSPQEITDVSPQTESQAHAHTMGRS